MMIPENDFEPMIRIEEMRSALEQRRREKILSIYKAQGIEVEGNLKREILTSVKVVNGREIRDSVAAEIVNGHVDNGITQEAADDPGCLCRVCKRLWCCEYRNG